MSLYMAQGLCRCDQAASDGGSSWMMGPTSSHGPYKTEAGGLSWREDATRLALKTWKGPRAMNAGSFRSWNKAKNRLFLEPPEGARGPCWPHPVSRHQRERMCVVEAATSSVIRYTSNGKSIQRPLICQLCPTSWSTQAPGFSRPPGCFLALRPWACA